MDTLDLEHALLGQSLNQLLALQSTEAGGTVAALADAAPGLLDGLQGGGLALQELLSGTVAGAALPLLHAESLAELSALLGTGPLGSVGGSSLDLGPLLDDLALPLQGSLLETIDDLLGLAPDGLPAVDGLLDLDGLLGEVLAGDLGGLSQALGGLPAQLGGLGGLGGTTLGSTLSQVETVIAQVLDQLEGLLGDDLVLPVVLDDLPLDETVQAIQQILGNTLVPLVGEGVDLLQDIVIDLQTALDAGTLAAISGLSHDLLDHTVGTVQAIAGIVSVEALSPALDLGASAIDQVNDLVAQLASPLGDALPVLDPALAQVQQRLDGVGELVGTLDTLAEPVLEAGSGALDNLVQIVDGALAVLAPTIGTVDALLQGGDLPLLGGSLGDPLNVLDGLPLVGDLLGAVTGLLGGSGLPLGGSGGLPLLGDLLGSDLLSAGLADPLAVLEGLPLDGGLLAPVQALLGGLPLVGDAPGLDGLLGAAEGLLGGDLPALGLEPVAEIADSLLGELPLLDGLTAPLGGALHLGGLDTLIPGSNP